ncbi:MAG: 50S ribosomal protein L9 [Candidatus Eremiobacteraeota bacterium]|nr:50S ribosomal protein L9 [Candidatus Eremiobacteraeota bacterium]MBV9646316.1 50S ribosomal protein L9 [Candidatus Eremiobacteraeota bacterium]
MKVILMSDVKPLGTAGSVVDVADGYARNYLMPKGLAAEASSGAIALLEQQKRAKTRREAEAKADAQSLAELLESKQILVSARSGGNGRLFGTVTSAQVADAIAADLNVSVDRHKIEMPENIKSLGSYPVQIKLGQSIVAKTTVKVVAA